MVQPSKSALAWAHQFPPPIPQGVKSDQAVVVRYDGVKLEGVDVIYAVIGADDLSRLPGQLIRDLEFSSSGADGELRGSPDAFFIGSERLLSLYVNTEAYPDFLDKVRDAAHNSGLIPLIGEGDLRLMTGPGGDLSAPQVPAFVENGMGYVPSLLAMSYLERVRPDHDAYSGPDPF
jgi:hypothetical protein